MTGPDLTARLREQATRRMDAPLIRHGELTVTAGDVWALVAKKIGWYRDAGVDDGSRVGVLAWPPLDFVTDIFAVFGLGGVVVPLSKSASEWELRRVGDSARLTHLAGHRRLVRCAGRWALDRVCGNNGASTAQLTSGTTGRQRAAMRTASALLTEAKHYQEALDLAPGDVIGCTLPLQHAYGFGLCAVAAPLAGVAVHYLPADRPRVLLRELTGTGVTLFPSVPPLLRLLAESAQAKPVTLGVRFLTAGMRLDLRTAELVGTGLGGLLGQVYGTTETGPICVRPPCSWQDCAASLGVPLPAVDVELTAPPGVPPRHGTAQRPSALEPGRAGVVMVRSPSTMLGYLGASEGSALDTSPLRDRWFATGDLGRWTADGLVLAGRLSTCINCAGEKISPEEIETVLLEFPAVRAALVVGVDDAHLGQRVKAIVTPGDVNLAVLRRFCVERLSRIKVPHLFEAVPALDTTESGKVLRSGPGKDHKG